MNALRPHAEEHRSATRIHAVPTERSALRCVSKREAAIAIRLGRVAHLRSVADLILRDARPRGLSARRRLVTRAPQDEVGMKAAASADEVIE